MILIYKKVNRIPIQFILLEIAYLAAVSDGDILFVIRPLAAYISLGKVAMRMRRKKILELGVRPLVKGREATIEDRNFCSRLYNIRSG